MAKQLLKERFQQLAGIKPLYEQEEESTKKATAVLSHDDYKSIYFGDEQEFRDEGFEFIETFNPTSPYTFVMWNDETLDVYDYNSEEEFVEEFREMGFGGCDDPDEEECTFEKIKEIINDSQPDRDSTHGLALLANGNSIAQGGD